jgi:hypothetical protein
MPDSDTVLELIRNHDLDIDTAERVAEIMEEHDLDEDEAIELVDEL